MSCYYIGHTGVLTRGIFSELLRGVNAVPSQPSYSRYMGDTKSHPVKLDYCLLIHRLGCWDALCKMIEQKHLLFVIIDSPLGVVHDGQITPPSVPHTRTSISTIVFQPFCVARRCFRVHAGIEVPRAVYVEYTVTPAGCAAFS